MTGSLAVQPFDILLGTGTLLLGAWPRLLGQLIAVANESFCKEIGSLPGSTIEEMERRVRIILGL